MNDGEGGSLYSDKPDIAVDDSLYVMRRRQNHG